MMGIDMQLQRKKEKWLTLAVSEDMKDMLRDFARANGVSMSAAARVILAQFFDTNLRKTQVQNRPAHQKNGETQ